MTADATECIEVVKQLEQAVGEAPNGEDGKVLVGEAGKVEQSPQGEQRAEGATVCPSEEAHDAMPRGAAGSLAAIAQVYGTVAKQMEQAIGEGDWAAWQQLQSLIEGFTVQYWAEYDAGELSRHLEALLRFGQVRGL